MHLNFFFIQNLNVVKKVVYLCNKIDIPVKDRYIFIDHQTCPAQNRDVGAEDVYTHFK